ncbi:Cystathionine beta-synthase [Sphaceloma murrayae]|uniref:Cystathionine beta-synthase n=1 Tax=Sphaceloma murrayae TaxID=2082308 RepID=A0A2K1QYN8_9PEZI|nr:Cystathionine beta-synthase [Sphaceloma murrayae]
MASSSIPPQDTTGGKSRPEDQISEWAKKYRGATVEDLDPPPALSISPTAPISHALMTAFERDYTHLTVVSPDDRALLGYLSIPRLKELLSGRKVQEADTVEAAMTKFQRKARKYKVISMDTPLEELEAFFEGTDGTGRQDFAVVTDAGRRFVLGVATRDDLAEFVRRRPA